jgi:hypothetical protein
MIYIHAVLEIQPLFHQLRLTLKKARLQLPGAVLIKFLYRHWLRLPLKRPVSGS